MPGNVAPPSVRRSELIRMSSITKAFDGPPVLQEVSIEFQPGEVHVLAGENGAGKSTLIRILGGVIGGYSGEIHIGTESVRLQNPRDAARLGVALIHQELSLVPEMSVLDNLLLGVEPTKGGFRDLARSREEATQLLSEVGLELDLETPIRNLPIGICQLLEVAKALRSDARLIAMDEPTSALNSQEVERLFEVIAKLKGDGRAIVYITHKMEEIHRLADRISVLRDGQFIGTYPAGDLDDEALIALMVGGKKRAEEVSTTATELGAVALELQDVTVQIGRRTVVKDANLSVRAGEVVGLAGLQGSGASELMQAVFGGNGRFITGSAQLLGQPYHPRTPQHAIRKGLGMLTNDRKQSGLVLCRSVTENATLVALPRFSPLGWRNPKKEVEATEALSRQYQLKAPSLDVEIGSLSGGNQQKVALGKWTMISPKVLLLDEPTRGIDIGAKREIYALIEQWKAEGVAILLITSELPELLLLCDRILVMHRGHIVREFSGQEATGEQIIEAAMSSESA